MSSRPVHLPNSPEPGVWQRLRLPQLLDFWAGELGSRCAWERGLARVLERRVEAVDAVTLVLKPNRRFRGLAPGQHVAVSAEVNGRRIRRSYSPSLLPGGRLAITVKRMPGGLLSSALCRDIGVGDLLELGLPFGELTLDRVAADAPLLLLAAGSGITPLASLLRAATAQPLARDITLLYWVRRAAERCFAAEFTALAQRQPRLQLHGFTTGDGDRRIDGALLDATVPDWRQAQVYACGPAGFVECARQLCAGNARGFAGEAFSLAPAPTRRGEPVRVTLARSGRALTLSSDQALLPALEAAGVQPAHGCRMGICNSCACHKLDGASEDLLTGVVHTEPAAALRLCVSRAAGDLTLDL